MPVCANGATALPTLELVALILSMLRKEVSTAQGQEIPTVSPTRFNQVALAGITELARQNGH